MKLSPRRLAGTALAVSALFGSTAALAQTPDFMLPFPCNATWQGITTQGADTPQAVEFSRPGDFVAEVVVASAAGTVSHVRDLGYGDAGRYIIIDHGDGWTSLYANLAQFDVAIGQHVATGQPIGIVGKLSADQYWMNYLYYQQSYQGMPESATFNGLKAHYWGSDDYTSQNCMHHHW